MARASYLKHKIFITKEWMKVAPIINPHLFLNSIIYIFFSSSSGKNRITPEANDIADITFDGNFKKSVRLKFIIFPPFSHNIIAFNYNDFAKCCFCEIALFNGFKPFLRGNFIKIYSF